MESVLAPYLPAFLYFAVVAATAAGFLIASRLLGPRRRDPLKLSTYECGVPLLGGTRDRFSVKFYLVAILFVLFDIETVFLIPWAVEFRQFGWLGILEMFIFLGILIIGLVYAFKRGALKWD
ncbi:MAG: NADH-quinone oxidoreductase subunit A [Planctomycetes bacterium]|nr:NADH-quinone oxidoreductase subunit A [Planctomycetota bacterium]